MRSQTLIYTVLFLVIIVTLNLLALFGYTLFFLATNFDYLNLNITFAINTSYLVMCSLVAIIIVRAHDLSLKEATKLRDQQT